MFERRVVILCGALGAYFVLIVVRLFHMQVVEADWWREQGENLSRRTILLPARRGAIMDRAGRVLAEDRMEHDLGVRLDEITKHPFRCRACGRPVSTTRERPPSRCRCGASDFEPGVRHPLPAAVEARLPEVRARYEKAVAAEIRNREARDGRVRADHVRRQLLGWWWPVLENVGPEIVKEVSLRPDRYRGFSIRAIYRRAWPGGDATRYVVGITTGVQDREVLARLREEFTEAQIWRMKVGRFGLERFLEPRLKAREGEKVVRRDRKGRVAEILRETPAQDGETIRTSLDLELQKVAVDALEKGVERQGAVGGAIVLMEPGSGEVVCIATWPPVRTSGVQRAVTPMVPGSVFKTVTAIAGLESGKLDPEAVFDCQGSWTGIGCHGSVHRAIDLADAIRVSCNGYFAKAGKEMGGAVLGGWARKLGFAKPTGIELPGEAGGVVGAFEGSPDYENRQIGFGQGKLTVSPLQVARLMAIIGNGGRFVTPTLLAGSGKPGAPVLHAGPLRRVRTALETVVRSGTASGVGLEASRAAGKTGTAELAGRPGNISWFAGYAPADSPRFAFACYLEGARDTGGKAAGPVVAALLGRALSE